MAEEESFSFQAMQPSMRLAGVLVSLSAFLSRFAWPRMPAYWKRPSTFIKEKQLVIDDSALMKPPPMPPTFEKPLTLPVVQQSLMVEVPVS